MQEALPTPFDITPIPYVAWEPNAESWVIVAATFAVILAFLLARSLFWRGARERAVRQLLRELARSQASGPGAACERYSRLARRILSFLVGIDLSGCSADELRRLASASGDQRESEVLELLARIEDCAYAPVGSVQSSEVSSLSSRVTAILTEYAGSVVKR